MPRQALVAAQANGTIALSKEVFAEITEVLERPKFARAISEDRRLDVIQLLAATAEWYSPIIKFKVCRDEKDNKYLDLASMAGAAAIVSGDADLLVLDPWQGIRILRAADFLAWIPR